MLLSLAVIIPVLRWTRLVAWAVVLLANVSAVLRITGGRARGDDAIRSLMGFIAASEIGFASIWIFVGNSAPEMHPAAQGGWVGSYVLSIMCALAALWIVGASERARRG